MINQYQLPPNVHKKLLRKFIIDKGDRNISKPLSSGGEGSGHVVFYNVYQPSSRVQCDQCKKNISKGAKILLENEEGKYLDFCMSCFSNLQGCQGQYHVVNKLDFPLLETHWTAQEELLLFQGLETHGYGNWNDIADFVGGGKTKDEVEKHYQRVYLDHANFMPKDEILTKRGEEGNLEFIRMGEDLKDNVDMENKGQVQQPSSIIRNTNPSVPQNKQSTTPAQVVGFMPRRGDFEVQYDNDAELLLAQMQFNDDDSEEEKAMKFRLIDIYNHKLTERIKRKQFVIERKLLDIREQMRLDKTRTKEEKEIHNLMKVLARFNTPEDHEKLVQNIIKEKQLRQRIAELKELLGKGFKTWGEVQDELQCKRKKDDKSKKKQQTYFMDKSKTTRRVARKDPTTQKSQKKVLYVTKEQQQLCNKMNMTFRQYISIKEKMMRQAVRSGAVDLNDMTEQIHVRRNISEAVLDFLVEQEDVVVKKKEEIVEF